MLDDDTINSFVYGNDIWVNNAAGYNGNHVEIFNLLALCKNNKKVHVPLSYGIPKYAKYVEVMGSKILGTTFDPILEFIPKQEYYKRFLNSNSFIFGHLRQCAMGNVIIALYLGGKVFMYSANPLFSHFKRLGVKVFSIDEELLESNLNTPLPNEERESNRRINMNKYSLDSLLNEIRNNFAR